MERIDKQLDKVLNLLWSMKYRNISAYDIEESGVSKFLVVATAVSTSENKKLASGVAKILKFEGKIDGWHKGEWIIFDMGDLIVHLFASGHREKYNMDKLYKGREINFNKNDKKKKI